MQNNFIRFAATLAIICLASSGLLSVVYGITRPKIAAQQLREEEESLKEVFPEAVGFEPVREAGEILYYKAIGQDEKEIGYVFKASSRGYSSDIVTIAGLDLKGRITNIKVVYQNETPGLGTRITEVIQKETLWDVILKKVKLGKPPKPWFQEQFSGKDAFGLSQNIDAITGATISSRAVIESVQEKASRLKELIRDER